MISWTKSVLLLGLFAAAASHLSCTKTSADSDTPASTPQSASQNHILIVYLSRTQNTKALAEIIRQHAGGDMVELELVTPYPDDYRATVAQVAHENETGYLPPLKTRIENMKDYDTVFVGFPTWGMQLPPPMKSFLRAYDLSGKTVIPFNTNGGYGTGSSFQTVRDLCPRSNVLDGFSVEGGRERDGILLTLKDERLDEVRTQVSRWLQSIQLLDRVTKP